MNIEKLKKLHADNLLTIEKYRRDADTSAADKRDYMKGLYEGKAMAYAEFNNEISGWIRELERKTL